MNELKILSCICGNDHIEKWYGWENLFAESGYILECPRCKLKTKMYKKTEVEAIKEWNEMQERLFELKEKPNIDNPY